MDNTLVSVKCFASYVRTINDLWIEFVEVFETIACRGARLFSSNLAFQKVGAVFLFHDFEPGCTLGVDDALSAVRLATAGVECVASLLLLRLFFVAFVIFPIAVAITDFVVVVVEVVAVVLGAWCWRARTSVLMNTPQNRSLGVSVFR